MTAIRQTIALLLLGSLWGCGGDALIDNTCDEPQRYQSAAEARRIVVPEGLDPLNVRMEMPIPKPKDAPSRPMGSRCIEMPPRVGTD